MEFLYKGKGFASTYVDIVYVHHNREVLGRQLQRIARGRWGF